MLFSPKLRSIAHNCPKVLSSSLGRSSLLWGAALLVGLLTPTQAKAENPAHVRQLLNTNRCEDCDLSGANLSDLDLTDAQLEGSDLRNANLNRTILVRADMQNTILRDASLSGTNFQAANLQNADVSGAQAFTFINSCTAEGSGSSPEECQFGHLMMTLNSELCQDSYQLANTLSAEDLELLFPGFSEIDDVNEFCRISDALVVLMRNVFSDSFLYGDTVLALLFLSHTTSFKGADLTNTNFTGANLSSSDLRYAALDNTNLTDADLTHVFAIGADGDAAINADWTNAYRTPADVTETLVSLAYTANQENGKQEAPSYLGNLSRGQQAHYFEYETFSSSISTVDVSLSETTEFYAYAIPYATPTYAIHTATPLQADFPSLVGIVFLGEFTYYETEETELTTYSILCEADMSSTDPMTLDAVLAAVKNRTPADEHVSCPEGFHEYDGYAEYSW